MWRQDGEYTSSYFQHDALLTTYSSYATKRQLLSPQSQSHHAKARLWAPRMDQNEVSQPAHSYSRTYRKRTIDNRATYQMVQDYRIVYSCLLSPPLSPSPPTVMALTIAIVGLLTGYQGLQRFDVAF